MGVLPWCTSNAWNLGSKSAGAGKRSTSNLKQTATTSTRSEGIDGSKRVTTWLLLLFLLLAEAVAGVVMIMAFAKEAEE
jgi:hypothetical protein